MLIEEFSLRGVGNRVLLAILEEPNSVYYLNQFHQSEYSLILSSTALPSMDHNHYHLRLTITHKKRLQGLFSFLR